jgi:hypothetical protein
MAPQPATPLPAARDGGEMVDIVESSEPKTGPLQAHKPRSLFVRKLDWAVRTAGAGAACLVICEKTSVGDRFAASFISAVIAILCVGSSTGQALGATRSIGKGLILQTCLSLATVYACDGAYWPTFFMYAASNFLIVLCPRLDVMGKKIGLALNAFGTLPPAIGFWHKTVSLDIALMSSMGCVVAVIFTVCQGRKSFANSQAHSATKLATLGCIAVLDSLVENFSGDRSTAVSDPPTLLTQVKRHLTQAMILQGAERNELVPICCAALRKARDRRVRLEKILLRCHSHLAAMEQARQKSFSPLQEHFSERIHGELVALSQACRTLFEALAAQSSSSAYLYPHFLAVNIEAMRVQHERLLGVFTAARMALVFTDGADSENGKRAQGLTVGSLRESQCLAARYSFVLHLGLMVDMLRAEVPALDGSGHADGANTDGANTDSANTDSAHTGVDGSGAGAAGGGGGGSKVGGSSGGVDNGEGGKNVKGGNKDIGGNKDKGNGIGIGGNIGGSGGSGNSGGSGKSGKNGGGVCACMQAWFSLHERDLKEALKVTLALSLGSLFVLLDRLHARFPHGVWVPATIGFVITTTSGASFATSLNRLIGTVSSYCVLLLLLSPPTAFSSYCILLLLHSPPTAFSSYCVLLLLHSPLTAFSSYCILLLLRSALTAFSSYCILLLLHSAPTAFCSYCILAVLYC